MNKDNNTNEIENKDDEFPSFFYPIDKESIIDGLRRDLKESLNSLIDKANSVTLREIKEEWNKYLDIIRERPFCFKSHDGVDVRILNYKVEYHPLGLFSPNNRNQLAYNLKRDSRLCYRRDYKGYALVEPELFLGALKPCRYECCLVATKHIYPKQMLTIVWYDFPCNDINESVGEIIKTVNWEENAVDAIIHISEDHYEIGYIDNH